jgi:hypothetical protein
MQPLQQISCRADSNHLHTQQQSTRFTCSVAPAGAVVVVSHSLQLLQQHQQPLQQCTALFSQLQSFLQGETVLSWLSALWLSRTQMLAKPPPAHCAFQHSIWTHLAHPACGFAACPVSAAAVKCVEVASSDWASAMADFRKRFDVQLKQELSDHGSSITGDQQACRSTVARSTNVSVWPCSTSLCILLAVPADIAISLACTS